MKVVVVAESFLPHMNGVTNSVLKVLAHLRRRGDDVTVIAPSDSFLESNPLAEHLPQQPQLCSGFPVVRVPSIPLPDYPKVRVAAGFVMRIRHLLEQLQPDVVHVASPFVLGWRAIQAADALGLPTVSIYQTEVPTYAARYRVPWAEQLMWQHVERMHNASTLTLVPSSFCKRQLRERGIHRLKTWRRGVDLDLFAPERRSERLRKRIAPGGQKLIGFVGRLAAEKQIEDLAELDTMPGTRLVIIGTGPEEKMLRRRLPNAYFAGFQSGDGLGSHVASLDVFVHPGEAETFCQTIQEAFAAAVPVVAVGRGGPVDLVDPGRTGWLYQPGDLEGMRAAVEHLINDDDARFRAGAEAHQEVQGRTWEAICNQLIGHYARAVDVNDRLQANRARQYITSSWVSRALLPGVN
ncbi:glycosyltransferase family 4 protein [Nesterenkonia haasae]|uniref:glycosyltransferase family 4 protein n=1 Tax=Nesterenkonia haasae TaxID=2587813 RepID=UPI001390A552|nr:glycosyltransferase family 1 protein [Nesterenkonia haasae]NDK32808.1 glycosyltransferase family 1 protein [Nesterenkonia haasae]